ncbi:uncharacterized protein LOC135950791 [Calliphora vicina]|uniref:uncharacterized protein LOC135950791 n=1 Tax=Calliphora vicina TaxID=7373 RepID=UPI00325BA153
MATTVTEVLAKLQLNNTEELVESSNVPVTNKTLKKISISTPVEDYVYNMKTESAPDYDDNDTDENSYLETFSQARDMVWLLLFGEPSLTVENSKKAAGLLEKYKRDAVFYCPWDYNDWIPNVRDELLKRKYFEFWQNVVVKNELGLCWARDSDYFHDMEDPKPIEFYKMGEDLIKQQFKIIQTIHQLIPAFIIKMATTVAKDLAKLQQNNTVELVESSNVPVTKTLKKISLRSPVEDYVYNMKTESSPVYAGDYDENSFLDTFSQARDMVWLLLFGEPSLTVENSKTAAELLEKYKRDAVFYCPWDYNDWIPKVRDELLKKKYFEFWQEVVVKNELGLCWAGDSDYFDDMKDNEPIEFYKVGEDLQSCHRIPFRSEVELIPHFASSEKVKRKFLSQ